jgi:hypothetical protein
MLAEVRCSGRAVRITSDELVDFNITRIWAANGNAPVIRILVTTHYWIRQSRTIHFVNPFRKERHYDYTTP